MMRLRPKRFKALAIQAGPSGPDDSALQLGHEDPA